MPLQPTGTESAQRASVSARSWTGSGGIGVSFPGLPMVLIPFHHAFDLNTLELET
jgi:hypothetical protein